MCDIIYKVAETFDFDAWMLSEGERASVGLGNRAGRMIDLMEKLDDAAEDKNDSI